MSGSTLRRCGIVTLALSLSLLPLASAQAAPREEVARPTLSKQIQDFGRTLFKLVQAAMGASSPDTTAGAINDPFGSDGIGIDPHGGAKP